jgi:hypothetical protein
VPLLLLLVVSSYQQWWLAFRRKQVCKIAFLIYSPLQLIYLPVSRARLGRASFRLAVYPSYVRRMDASLSSSSFSPSSFFLMPCRFFYSFHPTCFFILRSYTTDATYLLEEMCMCVCSSLCQKSQYIAKLTNGKVRVDEDRMQRVEKYKPLLRDSH